MTSRRRLNSLEMQWKTALSLAKEPKETEEPNQAKSVMRVATPSHKTNQKQLAGER